MATQVMLDTISALLKKIIYPAVDTTFSKEVKLYPLIRGNGGYTLMNNKFYITLRYSPNTGIGAISEGGALPSGKAKYLQMEAPIKFVAAGTSVTDQALEVAKTNEQALKNVAQDLVTNLIDDFKVYVNKIMYGAGDGYIGKAVGAGSTSDTLTVNSPFLVRVLGEDRTLRIGASTNVTVSEVVGADPIAMTTTVKLTSTASWSDGDPVYITPSEDPMGLNGLIDDGSVVGTIQGIDRTSVYAVNSWVDDDEETWSSFEVDTMTRLYTMARAYGGSVKVILMSQDMFDAYVATLVNINNYRLDPTKEVNRITAGYNPEGVSFMGGAAKVSVDPDIPAGTVYGISPEAFTLGEASNPFDWFPGNTGPNSVFKQQIDSDGRYLAAWECHAKYYFNVLCKNFLKNFAIKNKTVS